MIDEKVVMCDFKGIKPGMIVKIDNDWRDGLDEVCLVLDRVTYAHMLDEGASESYDPMLIVLTRGGRKTIPVDSVTVIQETSDDR